MRKTIVTAILLLLMLPVSADAFGLSGELLYLNSVDSDLYTGELGGAGAGITLLSLGIADVSLSLRVLGSAGFERLAGLYLKKMPAGDAGQAVFAVSDALVSLGTAWRLTDDMKLAVRAGVGDVGYVGTAEGAEYTCNLYRGLRVSGELRKQFLPSVELFARAEYGPHLSHVFGTHSLSSASWREVELGLQLNLLLGVFRGGVRVSNLREPHDSQRFAGVFVSGGVGF